MATSSNPEGLDPFLVDTLYPAQSGWEERKSTIMSRYSEQFKRDAVALYENNEDLSLNAASAELGINRASLHSWIKKYGTGKRARIKAVHEKAQTANDSERIRQ